MEGYIQLHRSLLRHWVSSDPEARSFWIEILLSASYKKHKEINRGRLVELDIGELLFSRPQWASRLNISESKIYRLLELFKQDGMVDVIACGRQYTRVKVLNWDAYQAVGEIYPSEKIGQGNEQRQSFSKKAFDESLQQGNEQETDNTRTSIKKESNKVNNTQSVDLFFDRIWKLYPEKKGKGQVSKTQKEKLMKIGHDHLSRCIDRYKLSKPDWKKWQNGSTFFNSGYIDYLDNEYENGSYSTKIQKNDNITVAPDEFRKVNGY